MTLVLSVQGAGRLDNGAPAELSLDRRGAIVGRASTCDWSLPDPTRHVSSRHFEVRYDGSAYLLTDCSTNGTILLSTGARLSAPHRIADGDRFQVGPYVLVAQLTGAATTAFDTPAADAGWQGWGSADPAPPPATGWGSDAAAPAASGWGASEAPSADAWGASASGGWGAPPAADTGARWDPKLGDAPVAGSTRDWSAAPPPPAAPAARSGWVPDAAAPPLPRTSTWEPAPVAPPAPSGWSSAAPDRPPTVSPDELWGRIADGNVVDWARGGFGQPPAPPADPLGLSPTPAAALPAERPTPPPPPPPPAATPPDAFAAALGIDPATLGPEAGKRGAALLRHLIAGLVVMLEARARAKAQLGAETTAFNASGHNPLKFARTPEDALAALLAPAPSPGFMPAEAAVEDAFRDLQSHQMATLRAMQGALRATLERFSPSAIRARADAGGMIERIVPAARDAALWQAYEREFGGVAQGSDGAFLDLFAKEFRQAYNDQINRSR